MNKELLNKKQGGFNSRHGCKIAQPSPAQPSPAQPSPAQPSPAQPSPARRKTVPSERITFGRNFRKARKAAKLSQRDITAIAGFAQSFVSEVETGKSPINIDNMAEMARVVGVPLWKLLKPDSD